VDVSVHFETVSQKVVILCGVVTPPSIPAFIVNLLLYLYLCGLTVSLFQVVIFRDGTYLTLKEVFESLDLTG